MDVETLKGRMSFEDTCSETIHRTRVLLTFVQNSNDSEESSVPLRKKIISLRSMIKVMSEYLEKMEKDRVDET